MRVWFVRLLRSCALLVMPVLLAELLSCRERAPAKPPIFATAPPLASFSPTVTAGDPSGEMQVAFPPAPEEHGRSELTGCRATARTRRISELDRRAADGSIGTASPVRLREVAPDGAWFVVCQARVDTNSDGKLEVFQLTPGDLGGDEVREYLVLGSGPGWGIDEVLGADPSGRYVAVREGACLEIVDSRTSRVTTLPNADLRGGGDYVGSVRAVAFDARGEQMLYLRGGSPERLIIRNLAAGSEKQIQIEKGTIYRAYFHPEGHWIDARVLPSGTTSRRRRAALGTELPGTGRTRVVAWSGDAGADSAVHSVGWRARLRGRYRHIAIWRQRPRPDKRRGAGDPPRERCRDDSSTRGLRRAAVARRFCARKRTGGMPRRHRRPPKPLALRTRRRSPSRRYL